MNKNIKLLIESIFDDEIFTNITGMSAEEEFSENMYKEYIKKIKLLKYNKSDDNIYGNIPYWLYNDLEKLNTMIEDKAFYFNDAYFRIISVDNNDNVYVNICCVNNNIILYYIKLSENNIENITDKTLSFSFHDSLSTISILLELYKYKKIKSCKIKCKGSTFKLSDKNNLTSNKLDILKNIDFNFIDKNDNIINTNKVTVYLYSLHCINDETYKLLLNQFYELGINKFKFGTVFITERLENPSKNNLLNSTEDICKQFCINNDCTFVLTLKQKEDILYNKFRWELIESGKVPINTSSSFLWDLQIIETNKKQKYELYDLTCKAYNTNNIYTHFKVIFKFYHTSKIEVVDIQSK